MNTIQFLAAGASLAFAVSSSLLVAQENETVTDVDAVEQVEAVELAEQEEQVEQADAVAPEAVITPDGVIEREVAVEPARAGKMVCQHGEVTRVIEVVYTGDGAVPCEVQYTKQESVQTLWSANNEVGYCEAQAQAFVEKQRGWGWQCDAAAADQQGAVNVEPAVEDVTEVVVETAEPVVEASKEVAPAATVATGPQSVEVAPQ